MRIVSRLGLALVWGGLAWLMATGTARADLLYNVTLNTAALQPSGADYSGNGPFSIGFQLQDGTFTGSGENTVTISNINLGAGSANGSPTTMGIASGTVPGPVILNDGSAITAGLAQWVQPVTFGGSISFTVRTTTNESAANLASSPDHFSFFIEDMNGNPIGTQTPSSGVPNDPNAFFDFDITPLLGTGLAGTESNESAPSGSYPVTVGPPTVVFGGAAGGGGGGGGGTGGGTGVPEPSTLALLALSLGGLAVRRVWRRGKAV